MPYDNLYGTILPGAVSITRSAALVNSLTERAKYKIKILDWHKAHGENRSLTARHFGIGRMTLYRWIRRFKHYGVIGLNEESRKPKHLRQPTTATTASNIVPRTVQLRKQYPARSKYKIKVLLKKEGIEVSTSTVGRILKRRGLIDKKIQEAQEGGSASQSEISLWITNISTGRYDPDGHQAHYAARRQQILPVHGHRCTYQKKGVESLFFGVF